MTSINKCRICGNTNLTKVLSLGEQFLTGVFPKNTEDKITCGPLELVKCHGNEGCSLLQLAHSYDSSEMYGENYGYRSGLNQSMVKHLQMKVESIQRSVALKSDDLVLDIGSNDGTLLSFYSKSLTRVGMDPTAAKFRRFYQPEINVIADFFSAERFRREFGEKKAKIITSIAMFYDLEDPVTFVQQIGAVLAEDGVWHFEQSYMPSMLESNAYDTICHEHLEYYGLSQIQWILERCGLKILDVEINDVNGGSFAVTAALKAASLDSNQQKIQAILDSEAGLKDLSPYQSFAERVYKHRSDLKDVIGGIIAQGQRIMGYGASTKGNVILQFCRFTSKDIPFIAEVNPDKFGSLTPGTLIPIVSEADAHAMKPDYFLVLPWHFRENLLGREKTFLNSGGKMIFPLPKIDIVSQ